MANSESGELIVRRSADQMYSEGQAIWPDSDHWHQHARTEIDKFITTNGRGLLSDAVCILDAGCGRDLYEWMPKHTICIDRYYEQVRHKACAVAGDIESLPFADAKFDLTICIGSVLNYVSALEAINELARVTRSGGRLVLQFETSSSFEQLGKASWRAPTYLNKTINSGRVDHIWIYSPKYVTNALKSAGFRIINAQQFHIMSALLARFGFNHQVASRAARFDRIFWWLGALADNIIVLAEKI